MELRTRKVKEEIKLKNMFKIENYVFMGREWVVIS